MNLYVGNLPFNTTSEDLAAMFRRFGEVKSAQVITDRDTGRSRGFGFIEMDDEEARRAIEELDGSDVGGRKLTVNQAQPRQDRGPRPGGGGGGDRGPRPDRSRRAGRRWRRPFRRLALNLGTDPDLRRTGVIALQSATTAKKTCPSYVSSQFPDQSRSPYDAVTRTEGPDTDVLSRTSRLPRWWSPSPAEKPTVIPVRMADAWDTGAGKVTSVN